MTLINNNLTNVYFEIQKSVVNLQIQINSLQL